MRLPDELVIAGRRYTVSTDPDELARESNEARTNLLGQCDRRAQRILVDLRQHDQQVADTLVHELLHAATELAGLSDELGDDLEERVVARLAPIIAQTIAENPDLVKAITKAWPR